MQEYIQGNGKCPETACINAFFFFFFLWKNRGLYFSVATLLGIGLPWLLLPWDSPRGGLHHDLAFCTGRVGGGIGYSHGADWKPAWEKGRAEQMMVELKNQGPEVWGFADCTLAHHGTLRLPEIITTVTAALSSSASYLCMSISLT